MISLEEKLPPWPAEARNTGDMVYKRVLKRLDTVVLKAYRAVDPAMTTLPPDILAQERKKFHEIALGEFSQDYFSRQGALIRGISEKVDFCDYLAGYAVYTAELTTAFLKGSPVIDPRREELITSLMRSVFADVAVVMNFYFDGLIEKAEADKRQAMETITATFEAKVGHQIRGLAEDAAKAKAAADSMATHADEASHEAGMVAAASEETSANVQAVAAASEELVTSVGEITRRVEESARVAEQAMAQARGTEATVRTLAEAASRIGEVVGLINSIAGQTNLLALNATIEASRAGDAGKGFAVVASEVKSLAGQTAKATDEIGTQITQIQQATREAVAAIEGIARTLGQVGEISTAIAGAVSQQGSATQDIARNVQNAADGTQAVTQKIGRVSMAAQETGQGAHGMMETVNSLARQADGLNGTVRDFLAEIKAS